MALTKVSRGLLTTSIVDNGNATAITIDSSENVFIGTTSGYGKATIEHASGINNGLTLSSSSATANGNITGIQFSQGATVTRPRAAIYAEAVESQSVAGHGADLCFATRERTWCSFLIIYKLFLSKF